MVSSIKPKAIEIFRKCIKVINIKRYCKNVDITDVDFIKNCCFKYLDGKWKRDDVAQLFVRFSTFSFREVKDIVNDESGDKSKLHEAIDNIAMHISKSIKHKDVRLNPIRYFTRLDGMSNKLRIIGVEESLHQVYDYVAVEGLMEMFNAKIGVFQCASLPNRGQSYGKKYIERWVRNNKQTYFTKGDIKKCFPSIPLDKLKAFLLRDVKNDVLLWLTYELIDMFSYGLLIGSYLSQYLCNYYLSYAYHYASEQLFKMRKTKRKGNVRVRLINHVLFYMDDFLLTGSSKKDLRKAMRLLIKYTKEFLGLEVKPDWKICKISDTEPIDMMGFVFRKTRTTIRTKIFIKTRRYFLKVDKRTKKGSNITLNLAYKCVSAFGWYKNTDSYMIREKLKIDDITDMCKKIISEHAKRKGSEINAIIS